MNVEELKVGDQVGISTRWAVSIGTVTRRTATQVIIGDQRFNKRGYRVGDDAWTRAQLIPADDAREAIAEEKARRKVSAARAVLNGYPWHTLTLEQCEQVQALLESFK